jgi:uncharacterized membrane protein required for colicin V production
MGLDLTLAGLVLLAGLRGWFKGFLLQAIRLAGVVSCVYVADPVRDFMKPRVIDHLPTIKPELVDRLLWWSSAVLAYVVLVGLASLVVKASRRKALGQAEPFRNDQFAGFLLGSMKGAVVAALLVTALQKYGLDHLKIMPWAERQAQSSRALAWNERYHPVATVWATGPVQHFVKHIQRMGLQSPEQSGSENQPVATADQPPKLALPPALPSDAEMVRQLREQLESLKLPDN